MELMNANREWSTRPADERFVSLTDMHTAMVANRQRSASKVVKLADIRAHASDNDVVLLGPNGTPASFTHWGFQQAAIKAQAPQAYLRTLPATVAADCLNYGFSKGKQSEEIGVYMGKDDSDLLQVKAMTGPNYSRVYNSEVTEALTNRFGDGVTGTWKVPGEFGQAVKVTKANTTIFGGNHSMFVFLADESKAISVKGRRHGEAGNLSRGFFVWNSETGAATFGLAFFLFDYACSNRIVWGASNYKEITLKHTKNIGNKWLDEMAPTLLEYANHKASEDEAVIEAAQAYQLGATSEERADWLTKRFNAKRAEEINSVHLLEEQRPVETIWDAVTGLTALAKSNPYQNERVIMERDAGKLLELVAN